MVMMKASFEQELQEKDLQIAMFRRELDSLLAHLEGLKMAGDATSSSTTTTPPIGVGVNGY